MVEYLLSEDIEQKTFELCTWCEQRSDPLVHLCSRMPLSHVRARHARAPVREGLKRIMSNERMEDVNGLAALTCVGALCDWSEWDLRRIKGVGSFYTRVIATFVLAPAGLHLKDISRRLAGLRRQKRMRDHAAKLAPRDRFSQGEPS